jgi:tRNA (pseudouridine54-N1)-methyltransferase
MCQFIVVGHEAPTTPEFALDDITGGAGRLDVLCRCVTAACLLSHGIREDVTVRLVLQDTYTLRFEGAQVRNLNPDERSTAALVRTALEQRAEAVGHQAVETSPGVFLTRRGLEPTLQECADCGRVVGLHEEGTPAVDVTPPTDPVFVLSDHREFTDAEAALLDDVAETRLRLGPRRLHADQAITVAHNYLDTDGFTQY